MNRMETCIVTGGAGFMGSHIARDLLKLGYKVVVLDDLSGGFVDNLPKGIKFIKGSVTDKELVDKIFKENHIDYVFHLAAYAAENLSHFIKRFNYNINLIGSVNLINAAINNNVKCFVFTSSIAVYGKNQLPMHEAMMPMPEDSYGISKLAVELELKISHEMFGLNYIIFRPHNVFGEHQNIGDKYRNVIGIFMNQLMQGKPLTIFGDGEQTRAFSYIRDISPIIAKSIQVKKAYNEIFNIGAEETCTVNKIAKEVMKVMGKTAKIRYLKARKEVKHAYSTHKKIKKFFGYENKYTLQDGLINMAEWAKKFEARKSKEFSDIEVKKNLPEGWC